MISAFSVVSRELFDKITKKFNSVKKQDGLDTYLYYGNNLENKPKWDSIYYMKESILEGDLFELSNRTNYNRKTCIEDMLDMNNFVVLKITLTDEDQYRSDLSITNLGSCNSLKEALNIMDIYDPFKNIHISFNSSMEFIFNFIFHKEEICRNVKIKGSTLYHYTDKLFIDNPIKLDLEKYSLNIDNLKRINSLDIRCLVTSSLISLIDSSTTNLLKEVSLVNLEYLISIVNGQYRPTNQYRSSLTGLSPQIQKELIGDVIELLPVKDTYNLFEIYQSDIMNSEEAIKFINAFYTSKYTFSIIEYFTKHKNLLDISKIDKKRFIKAASITKYNELTNYEVDPKILYISDSINSAGTTLAERIITLACFVNTYSEDEFKELDLNILADALNVKLMARFTYELNSDLSQILGNRTENIKLLCDKVVEKMCASGCNAYSRVKLIKENSSKNKDKFNIFNLLENSLNNSEEPKIIKALLKISI